MQPGSGKMPPHENVKKSHSGVKPAWLGARATPEDSASIDAPARGTRSPKLGRRPTIMGSSSVPDPSAVVKRADKTPQPLSLSLTNLHRPMERAASSAAVEPMARP